MKKLKVGIIGYGVGKHHADAYVKKNCDIKIYDKNKITQKKILLDNFQLIKTEKEFFKNRFDIISIASHDKYHFNHIIKSSKITHNIFCEKPICNNFSQLKKIKKLVKKNKINFQTNFVLRAISLFRDIKNKIRKNYFGKIFFIEGSYLWSRVNKMNGWRSMDKDYSFIKGASIHIIDLVCWLIENKPTHVYAVGNNIGNKNKNNKDTMISIILEFGNKLYIQINAFGPSIYPHYHELKVFGSNATSINQYGNNFFIKNENKLKRIKNNTKYPDHKNKKKVIINFINNIDKKKFLANQDIFDTMCICFAAEKSIKQKKRIKIKYL